MPTLTGVRLYGTKDTDANWTKNNPLLSAGEIIIVTDSKYKLKIATTNAKYSEIEFPVAEKATKLETARKIGNASFNGTSDITLAQIGAAASSHTHTKSQITDFPSSLKNPTSIVVKLNGGSTEGTNLFTYDGGTAKTVNITPSSIGAAASSHTHTKSQITDFPTTLKNPNSIIIKLNGGNNEGTNMFTYDGSNGKTINITPSSIGAATSGHNHDSAYAAKSHIHNYAGSSSAGGAATSSNKVNITQLSNTIDLNDLTTDGLYYFASGGNSIKNNPVDTQAFEIYIGRNATGYIYQRVTLLDGSVYIRTYGSNTWSAWKTTVDSSNYTSYTVTKTGSGASGTWGISISGNAGTATTANSAKSVAWGNVTGKPSTFTPSSHTHTKSQITDFPSTLANPNSIVIKLNGGTTEGTNLFTYNGSSAKSLNITASAIGAAASSHTHTKSQITDFPSTLANPNSIIIKLNGGTTEGTNLFTYNGSSAKTLNITPSSIGAAASSHTHTKSQISDFPSSMPASDVSSWAKASTKPSYSWSEITGKPSSFTPSSHTHSQYYDSGQSRTANTVLAAPNGSDGSATFRKLVAADIPALSYLSSSGGTITGDLKVNKSISTYGLEIYHTSTPFIDFHYNNDTNVDYTSRIIELEKGKLNVNGTVFTDGGSMWTKKITVNEGMTIDSGDISVTRGMKLNHGNTSVYLYNESGNFCMMHTGTDGKSTWPIIWNFTSGDIYIGGNIRANGTGKFPNGIYGGKESLFYVNSSGGCTAASFGTDGTGSFTSGITAGNESKFYIASNGYTDPMPGTSCAIKATGIIAANAIYARNTGSNESQVHARNDVRDVYLCASSSGRAGIYDTKYGWIIYNETDIATTYIGTCKIYNGKVTAKADSTSWLTGASPGGASFESINTTSGALVPGMRIRTEDGAWVLASYAYDPGFRLYYAKAARLAGGSDNTYDQIFTFGSSGTFYTKALSQTSDERRKDVVEKLSTVLPDRHKKFFMDIKPFTFKWNDNPDDLFTHYGVGAQTLYKSAKDLGFTDDELGFIHKGKDLPDGNDVPWSVSYEELIPLNIKVTQDHERKLEEQKKEIMELKEENKNLSDCIAFLEKENQKILDMLSELLKK